MEAWDAIRARRNVREYTSEPVSDDDLNRIAEAGWRAPSAKNRQAWDFVIVTDKGQLQELSTVWRGAGHIAGAAAAIALVIPEPPDERRRVTDQYDVGQATMAIMLAATDLGIGTGHLSVGEQGKARISRRPAAQADPQAAASTVRWGCAPRTLVSRLC
jgi:nitroreductase